MALDTSSMLLKLNPLSAIDLGGSGNVAQMGMERQALMLKRQEFEERKRQNAEDNRLREMELNGRATAQRMETEREREKAKALMEAKRREQAEAAYGAAHKAVDSNDQAGVSIAANQLREYGGLAEELPPDAQGRPNWRLGTDAAAYGQRRQQADAVTRDIATNAPEGSVWVPPDVTKTATLDRLGALGLSGLDREGVVSMGQNADTRRAQTQPALDAVTSAYPAGARRESQSRVSEGVAGMGLSPLAALELQDKLTDRPGAAVEAELAMGRDVEKADLAHERTLERDEIQHGYDLEKSKAAAAPKPLTRADIMALAKGGAAKAKEMYVNRGIADTFGRGAGAQAVIDLLEDDDPNNDEAIAFELPNMLGSKGAQSNKDLAVALGMDAMSTVDQIKEHIKRIIEGGYTEMRKESLIAIVKNKMAKDDDLIHEYLDAASEAAGSTDDPDIRRGLDEYTRENIPKHYRDAWSAHRDAESEGDVEKPTDAPAATPIRFNMVEDAEKNGPPQTESEGPQGEQPRHKSGDLRNDATFMGALDAAAEKWKISAKKLLPLLNIESAGEGAKAANPHSSARGIIQMLDKVAVGFTNPRTGEKFKDSDELAELTAAEQADIAAEYIASKGVKAASSMADYALAIAAPRFVGKPRDTVVYRKGSDDHRDNRGWRPPGGGDITVGSILDFYLGKGSGDAAPLQPVGGSSARPGPAAARARARAGVGGAAEPERAEDGIPDARPSVGLAKARAKSRLDDDVLGILK